MSNFFRQRPSSSFRSSTEDECGDLEKIGPVKQQNANLFRKRWLKFNAAFLMMCILTINKVASIGIGEVIRIIVGLEKNLLTGRSWMVWTVNTYVVILIIGFAMEGVAWIEKWMTDSNYSGSKYKNWLLRKTFVRSVFIPRLIENVSFLSGSVIAALLEMPTGAMRFVSSDSETLPLSDWVELYDAVNVILSTLTTVFVSTVAGIIVLWYYGINYFEEEESGLATLRKTFFQTANWTCAAYFFSLINPRDLTRETNVWLFAGTVLKGIIGAILCMSLSFFFANLHGILEQKLKAGSRMINSVLFLIISAEIITQSTMIMSVLFMSSVLKFPVVKAESVKKTVAWSFVSLMLVTSLLWSTLLTKESKIRELKLDSGLTGSSRRTTILRGWNPVRLWIETWASSYLLADTIKAIEKKYVAPAKTSAGVLIFTGIVFCEIVIGYILLALTSILSKKTKKKLLEQSLYKPCPTEDSLPYTVREALENDHRVY